MPPPQHEAYGSKQGFIGKNKWYLIGGGIVAVGAGAYFIIHGHSSATNNAASNVPGTGSLGTTTGGEQYLIPSSGSGGYGGGGGGGALFSEISSLESDITGLTSALTGIGAASTPPSTPAISNGTTPALAGSGSPSGSSGSISGNASSSGGGTGGSTSPPVAVTNTVQTFGVGDFDTTVNNTLLDQALTSVQTTGAPSTVAQSNALATFSSEGHPIADTIDPTVGSGPAGQIPAAASAIQAAPGGGQNQVLAAANAKYGGIAGNPSMYG
jgi:hypothetical protein